MSHLAFKQNLSAEWDEENWSLIADGDQNYVTSPEARKGRYLAKEHRSKVVSVRFCSIKDACEELTCHFNLHMSKLLCGFPVSQYFTLRVNSLQQKIPLNHIVK